MNKKINTVLTLFSKNKRAHKIYQESLQLRKYSQEVIGFMLNAVRNINLNKDLINWFEVLYNIVKKTDQFPHNYQFKIKNKSSFVFLDSKGNIIRKSHSNWKTAYTLDPLLNQIPNKVNYISLNGLDDIEEKPFLSFLYAFIQGKLNKLTYKAFASASNFLSERWHLEKLRSFYSQFGNHKWIPPIDDFKRLDLLFNKNPDYELFSHHITYTMANAGKLGFCPTQYLRKIINPLLNKHLNNFISFKKITTLAVDCFKYIKQALGEDGDGSASNIFTLKYFIKPISNPLSRLFNENYYQKGIKNIENTFFSLARAWADLFKNRTPYTKDLIRFYADVFLEGITRIEIPKEIERQVYSVLNHIKYLSSVITTRKKYKKFLKPLQTKGVKLLLKNVEKSGRVARFLKLMQKHFELVEDYSRTNFGIHYIKYMKLWSAGLIQKPEDINAFIELSNSVAKLDIDQSYDIISTVMSYAKTKQDRDKLLYFLKNCVIFDREIYLQWLNLDPEAQIQALKELNSLIPQYLCNSQFQIKTVFFTQNSQQIEHAMIMQLVRTSKLNKQQISIVLNNHLVSGRDPVSEQLSKPEIFKIAQKNTYHYKKTFLEIQNSSIDFFKQKLKIVFNLFERWGDDDYRTQVLNALIKRGIAHYTELSQYIASVKTKLEKQENKSLEKKLAGLVTQFKIPSLFISLLRMGRDVESKIRQLFNELTINFLFEDKNFTKHNHTYYANLILSSIIREGKEDIIFQEPFLTIYNMEEDIKSFSLEQLECLKEIFTACARDYFNELYAKELFNIPAGLQVALINIYKQIGVREAADSFTALSDHCYNTFITSQSYKYFDQKIRYLERNIENLYSEKKREVLIVGAKRKIDQFYGHVGEICIAEHYSEIKRRNFIPLRIVDKSNLKLIGYIHFFLIDMLHNNKKLKVALIGGIEPKTSWLSYLKEIDFYQEVRSLLIKKASELKANILCIPKNNVAHSNVLSLKKIISVELHGKPLIKNSSPFTFPKDIYDLSEMVVIWSNAKKN